MEIILAGSLYYFLDNKEQKGGSAIKINELAMKYIENKKRPETIVLELTGNKKLQDKLNTYIKNKSLTDIKKDINCLRNKLSGMQVGGMHQGEEHDDICGICRSAMHGPSGLSGSTATSTLVCGHVFHRDCIRHWWDSATQNAAAEGRVYRPSCPICQDTRGIRADSICEMVTQAEFDFRDGALDLVGIRRIPHLTDGQRRAQEAIQIILVFLFMIYYIQLRLNTTVVQ